MRWLPMLLGTAALARIPVAVPDVAMAQHERRRRQLDLLERVIAK